MNDLIENDSQQKISPWEKPGGTLGLIVVGGAIAGGCILLYKILPFLITLTTNILTLAMLVGVLALIAFLISDKRFRKTVSMVYFMIMRKITGLVIEIDPIAIVEQKVKEMKEKIQVIEKQMGNIRGLILQNDRRVKNKKAELEKQLGMLKQYEQRNMLDRAKITERQVVRLQAAVERQTKRLEDSQKWMEILKQLKERADLVVIDTENEVNDRKEEYESIKAQHKAFSSIMSIIKGNPDDLEDFTRAMDYMAHDISMRLGEMSNVIDETGGLLSQISVEDGVTSDKAKELLQKYENEGIDGLFAKSNSEVKKAKLENNSQQMFNIGDLNNGSYEEQVPIEVVDTNSSNSKQIPKRSYFD